MTIENHSSFRRRYCNHKKGHNVHHMYVCIEELEMMHKELHNQLMWRHMYYECNVSSCKRSYHTMYENDMKSGLGRDCKFCKKGENNNDNSN